MSKEITVEVNIYNVTMEVTGYYHPEEATVWYDDNMEGHPGYNADFEVESVKVEGIDILAIISDEVYSEIITKIIEQQS